MQSGNNEINPYLQQEVLGASPIRLRLMLITRAEELCSLVEHLWQNGDDVEAQGWLLRIREILGELLSGVCDASNPLGKTVSDLYVFMLKMVTEVEAGRDVEGLKTFRSLMQIELETWTQVLRHEATGQLGAETPSAAQSGHIIQDVPKPIAPTQQYRQSADVSFTPGSFSVEA